MARLRARCRTAGWCHPRSRPHRSSQPRRGCRRPTRRAGPSRSCPSRPAGRLSRSPSAGCPRTSAVAGRAAGPPAAGQAQPASRCGRPGPRPLGRRAVTRPSARHPRPPRQRYSIVTLQYLSLRGSLRDSEAADRWTWLVIAAHTQLRLARPLVADLRHPWERPVEPNKLTPARVRRGFRNLHTKAPSPARAPKPTHPRPRQATWLEEPAARRPLRGGQSPGHRRGVRPTGPPQEGHQAPTIKLTERPRVRQTAVVRIDETAKLAATRVLIYAGIIIASPILLIAGDPIRIRYLHHIYREDAPPVVDTPNGIVRACK